LRCQQINTAVHALKPEEPLDSNCSAHQAAAEVWQSLPEGTVRTVGKENPSWPIIG
jgi:hypothetical protein